MWLQPCAPLSHRINVPCEGTKAGRRMGLSQPKLSNLLPGDFTNLSERKLMECLNRLGYNIGIKLIPATKPVGS